MDIISKVGRSLFKGTAVQQWPITNRLYRHYVRFRSRNLPGDAETVTVNFRGLAIDIERDDITILPTLLTGEYEHAELDALMNVLTTGSTFVDVGANVGLYTLLALRAVGADGRVLAVEPNPATRTLLARNVERVRGLGAPVEVAPVALADYVGDSAWESTEYQGTGHLASAQSTVSDSPTEHGVKVTTLDALVGQYGLNLDGGAIKVDVEGFEPLVVIGGEATIRSRQPIMLIELCGKNSRDVGVAWGGAIDILASTYHSLQVFGPLKDGDTKPLGTRLEELVADGRLHNILLR